MRLITNSLRICEHRVYSCNNNISAVKIFNEGNYDLVIINCDQRELEAVQLARILRGLQKPPTTKFLAFCSENSPPVRDTGEGRAFDGLLFKPFNFDGLQRTIGSVLENSVRRQTHEASTRIWRQCGLDGRPKAVVVPDPAREAAQVIDWCFDIVSADEADIILATSSCTKAMIEAARERPGYAHLPVIDQSGQFTSFADAAFQFSEIESWSSVARTIAKHRERRALLSRDYARAANAGDRLLVHLFLSDRGLTPRLDPNNPACVSYPGFWPEASVSAQAPQLVESGMLSRSFVDRLYCCSCCQSRRLSVREECLNCRSAHLSDTAVIHHFSCAYQGPEKDFRQGVDLICPKCRRRLRHYGGDYDKPGSVTVCESCGSSNSDPAVGFVCFDCRAHMDGETCPTTDIFAYALSDFAVAQLTRAAGAEPFKDMLPLKVRSAARRFAAQTDTSVDDLAVIEISYGALANAAKSTPLESTRALFIQNMADVLAGEAGIVATRDRDYVIVSAKGEEGISEFADGLVNHCERPLAKGLAPKFRVLDKGLTGEAA